MKTLLIVYHTRGVKNAEMAEAVARGARSEGSHIQGIKLIIYIISCQ